MEPAAQLLVASPDGSVLRAVQRCVIALGHVTYVARTLAEARRLLARMRVDLICLDSVFPHDESERLWRWLSADSSRSTPAVILLAPPSARTVPGALPAFFQPERDGLVPKPLDARELARETARLLAGGLRRGREAVLLQVGPMTLDGATRQLFFAGGGVLSPTPTEFRLLRCLMERPGEFVSAEELVEQVWNYPSGTGGPELVRAHVSNLRRKLRGIGQDPQLLRTIPYRGYGFMGDERPRRS